MNDEGHLVDSRRPLTLGFDLTPLVSPNPSGVATFVRELAARIGDHIDVHGYSLIFRRRREWPDDIPESVQRPSGWRRGVPVGVAARLWRMGPVPSGRLWTGRVDVMHGTNFLLPPTRKGTGIVTVHDMTHLHFPTAGSARTLSLLEKSVERGAIVHVPSQAIKSDLMEVSGLGDDAVEVIPHGVPSLSEVRADDEDEARVLTFGRPHILAVGDMLPRKEIPLLIAAFDELAETDTEHQLVIIGNAKDQIEAYKIDQAKAHARHGERITIHGWLGDGAKSRLMRSADLFVYPSSYEGFGLPVLEAQSVGVPVVAARIPAIQEVAGNGVALFESRDLNDLTGVMRDVIQNDALQSKLKRAGTENCGRFSWTVTAEKFAALYERVGRAS